MLRIRARHQLELSTAKNFIKLLRTSSAKHEYLPISHGRENISRRGEISNNINKCMIINILDKNHTILTASQQQQQNNNQQSNIIIITTSNCNSNVTQLCICMWYHRSRTPNLKMEQNSQLKNLPSRPRHKPST